MNEADGEIRRRRHADRTRANLDHTRIAVHEERWEGHRREHLAEFRALTEARSVIDARLADMNELRRQIDRERGGYATREMVETLLSSLEREVTVGMKALGERLSAVEKWQANTTGRLAMGAIGFTVFMTIVVFAANYLTSH